MRIIFAGTSEFALPALRALVNAHNLSACEVVGVYTQPDRPSGRGRSVHPTPIKQCALDYQLPVYQPTSLKKQLAQVDLRALQPDLMVVAAYGLLLPEAVLTIPKLGCINIHGSLLPRWRGAAPIQRALLEGDTMTGVTIMQMEVGLDTGPILYQQQEKILAEDTAVTLQAKLATLGAAALLHVLDNPQQWSQWATSQDHTHSTYANKLDKQEGLINWALPAVVIERQIRAFNPWPICFTYLRGMPLKVWEATVWEEASEERELPGTLLAVSPHGITVSTGKGHLLLTQLQKAGGRRLPVSHLLNGSLSYLKQGMRFDATA
jgi:methionyl-tRNA formyltransferase